MTGLSVDSERSGPEISTMRKTSRLAVGLRRCGAGNQYVQDTEANQSSKRRMAARIVLSTVLYRIAQPNHPQR